MTTLTPDNGEVIYEVTLEVAPRRIEDFDAWLPGHVRELLAQPGFFAARIQRDREKAADGWHRRVVSYRLRNREALDDYLAGPAEALRADGVERFGKQMRASRRVLTVKAHLSDLGECENCASPLYGQYCRDCGQRRDSPIQSLPRMGREALDHLFNADSRIWRTLRDLALRPGALTHRYLHGGRVHYTPPFRLYILLSLLFFLGLSLLGGQNLPLFQFGAEPLSADVSRQDEQIERGIQRCLESDMSAFGIGFAGLEPERLTRRMRTLCIQVAAGDTQGVYRQVLGNASTALFLMLPLMAGFMRVIYPLSRRYFVNHLLFLTHFHAFLFLLLIVLGGNSLLATRLDIGGAWLGWTWAIGVVWIFIWLGMALRRVYAQGYFLTAVKYLLLAGAYLFALPLLIVALLIWTLAGF
ncbi:DUF4286 family protein [Natronospira bacteriovora]|uniref:DUF4286 family protein n=1 Tax=Natronospira bacteriovora TaxID=3069753 RepID=A0ABU0W9Y9_9GAMM|nr:DUF4286 family protein [Natronospira sp. AB-CW4]MDQ2070849.1 DUF4286 family protein [Natronospira sp. AB-CW4]